MSNEGNQAAAATPADYAKVSEGAYDQVRAAQREGVATGENEFDMAYRFAVADLQKAGAEVDSNALFLALTGETQRRG